MRSQWLCLVTAILSLVLVGAAPAALLREQRPITVAGVRETWRLVWASPPKPMCPETDVVASITCPCSGWAYGEAGDLVLVRERGGLEIDRLRLAPLFGKYDHPGAVSENVAYVQRWPMKARDFDREEAGDAVLAAEIRRRPPAMLIRPADYNRDGEATEFLVQVGTLPCGKLQFAAVGVTKARPRLHALGSARHPEKPLALPLQAWEALLRGDHPEPVRVWECDDHGSEVRSMLQVSARNGVIHVVNRDYGCVSGGNEGRLVRTREW